MSRILLLADGIVGLEIVSWLTTTHAKDIVVIITASDNDIAEVARAAGVPTIVFSTDETVAAWVREREHEITLGFTLWWPKILRAPLLNLPRRGFINTHPSLLPHARGKHYNFWTIVEGAPFGVTLHLIDEGIDTGPIVAQRAIAYGWEDDGESLYKKAQAAMPALFRDIYPQLRLGNFQAHPQDLTSGSFHAAKEIDPASMIDLDSQYTGRQLLNLLRARTFAGHPACYFVDEGRTYEVRVQIGESEL